MENVEHESQREKILNSIVVETPVESKEVIQKMYASGVDLRFALNLEVMDNPTLKLWLLKNEDPNTTHTMIDQKAVLRGITGYIKSGSKIDSYSIDNHNRHRQEKFDDTIIKSAFERFINS